MTDMTTELREQLNHLLWIQGKGAVWAGKLTDGILELIETVCMEVIGEDEILFGHGEDYEGTDYNNDLRDEQRTTLLRLIGKDGN